LGRATHNDHGVKSVAAVDHVPSATGVDGVVHAGAGENLTGLVMELAENGGWIFHGVYILAEVGIIPILTSINDFLKAFGK